MTYGGGRWIPPATDAMSTGRITGSPRGESRAVMARFSILPTPAVSIDEPQLMTSTIHAKGS